MGVFNNLVTKQQPQLVPAEVLDILYGDDLRTYQFAIKVREYNQPGKGTNVFTIARPLNANIKQIPIIGETVLLLRTISPFASAFSPIENIYYISIVGIQGSIHHNALPAATFNPIKPTTKQDSDYENSNNGNTSTQEEQEAANTIDENFPENSNIKALQPYLGDILIEGRFGNSIRLSSTQISTDLFKVQPFWSKDQGNDGDPIIVIRNTSNHIDTGQYNDFTTENLSDDSTDIVISSTQKIDFTPAVSIGNVLQNAGIETEFIGNQTLINSGRILLNSKEKDVTVTATTAIGLTTDQFAIDSNNVTISAGEVKIGANANEPMVLGNQLKSLMSQLITAIGNLTVTVTTPTGPGQTLPLITSPAWGNVQSIVSQFDNALSRFAYVSQTNNSNVSSTSLSSTTTITTPTEKSAREQEDSEDQAEIYSSAVIYDNETGLDSNEYNLLITDTTSRLSAIAQSSEVDPIILNSDNINVNATDIEASVNSTSRIELT